MILVKVILVTLCGILNSPSYLMLMVLEVKILTLMTTNLTSIMILDYLLIS